MVLEGARIAVLIPAYNEGTQIAGVLKSVPSYVDSVMVINDASTDNTTEAVLEVAENDPRVSLIELPVNRGVGGALCEGFKWARDSDVDIAVTIDGDGQMDPDDMRALLQPLLDDTADFTKGNRLSEPEAWREIPRIRLFGNSVLTLLTKIVSGYWHVTDSQSGYSAVSRYGLDRMDWDSMYARYGRPNDTIVLANIADCRLADVPVRPVYGVGEKSSMKILKVLFTISLLLFRRFWWRLGRKYILQDFHPLVFFYGLAILSASVGAALFVRMVYFTLVNGYVPQMTSMAAAFMAVTTLNSLFFAFWMDKEANADLAVKTLHHSLKRTKGVRHPRATHENFDSSGDATTRPDVNPEHNVPPGAR